MDAEVTAARPKKHFQAIPLQVADVMVAVVFVAAAVAYVRLGGLAGTRLAVHSANRDIGLTILIAPVSVALLAFVFSGRPVQSSLLSAVKVGAAGVACGLWLEYSASSASPLLLPSGLIAVLVAAKYLRGPHAWALWAVLCLLGGWLSVAASVLIVGEFDQLLRNAPLVTFVYAVPTGLLVRFVRRRSDELLSASGHPSKSRTWWRRTAMPLLAVSFLTLWGLAIAYVSISLLAREIPANSSLDETGRLFRSAEGAAAELERAFDTGPGSFDEQMSARLLPLSRAADMAFYVFTLPDGGKESGNRLDLSEAHLVAGAQRSLEPQDIDEFRVVHDLGSFDPSVRAQILRPFTDKLGIVPFDAGVVEVRSAWMAPVAVPLFSRSAVENDRMEDWRWVLVAAPSLPYAGMPLSSLEIANGAFTFAFPWLLTFLLLPSSIVLEVMDRREAASSRAS